MHGHGLQLRPTRCEQRAARAADEQDHEREAQGDRHRGVECQERGSDRGHLGASPGAQAGSSRRALSAGRSARSAK
eukprot:3776391-Lingulodinium_polyedra.AAC.1